MNHTENQNTRFTPEMTEQMKNTFEKMEKGLLLKLTLDQREASAELEAYVTAMADMTDKLTWAVDDRHAPSDKAPCVEICHADGASTGLAFFGVPAGHEFSSFLQGLYHAATPELALDDSLRGRIAALKTPMDIRVLVTLTCPMCPELVMAAQQIAAINPGVTAHIYDIRLFDGMRERYHVMSVPYLVVNDDKISVGRKSIRELLDFLEE